MEKIELLAPAGNFTNLMSALNKTSTPYASNNQKAVANALGTKTVSGLMSVMA